MNTKGFSKAVEKVDGCACRILQWKAERDTVHAKTMKYYGKSFSILMMAALIMSMTAMPVLADTTKVLGNVLGLIVTIFRYIGMVLLVWGVAQFVLATKRSDAESKSDAIQTIICAIALMAIKTIVNNLGLNIEVNEMNLD